MCREGGFHPASRGSTAVDVGNGKSCRDSFPVLGIRGSETRAGSPADTACRFSRRKPTCRISVVDGSVEERLTETCATFKIIKPDQRLVLARQMYRYRGRFAYSRTRTFATQEARRKSVTSALLRNYSDRPEVIIRKARRVTAFFFFLYPRLTRLLNKHTEIVSSSMRSSEYRGKKERKKRHERRLQIISEAGDKAENSRQDTRDFIISRGP